MLKVLQRYREPLLVGALLIWPLISFLSSSGRAREPHVVDRAVLALAAPVQGALSWVMSSSGHAVGGYIALRGAHEEAGACRRELAEANAERNSMREAVAENARLKELLGYLEGTVSQEIVARVVGGNPSSLSLRINRGLDDGVRVGMPVVTHSGVVGQVVRSVDRSADVMVLSDPASRIGATVQRTRVRGIVLGGGDQQLLSVDYVHKEDDLIDGDILVTSGTDGIFPAGLSLGTVTGVSRPPARMFLVAKLAPSVTLRELEEVLVIPLTIATGEVRP